MTANISEAASDASMLQRGRVQLGAGLDALAIESFRAAIRQNPDDADAYNGLAVAYGRIGRNDLAQRYFETALAKDPSNERASSNLAKLTGGDAAEIRMAVAPVQAVSVEPVAVVVANMPEPIGDIVEELQLASPVLAALPTTSGPAVDKPVRLGSKGVISRHFAVAPARLAPIAATQRVQEPTVDEQPDTPPEQPKPLPQLPVANLPAEYRGGHAKLERISLAEVRLITQPHLPLAPSATKTAFDSFGDRLAQWLPGLVAMEQSARPPRLAGTVEMLAAVERAARNVARADVAAEGPQPLPEFAYLFFDDDNATTAA